MLDYLAGSHTITGALEGQREENLTHKSGPHEDTRQRHGATTGLEVWNDVVTSHGTPAATRD